MIHFEAFKHSLKDVNQVNAEQPNAGFDINSFSDNTPEEMENHIL